MYKYDLIISIFSKTDDIEDVIKTINPSPKFEYKINSYKEVNDDIVSKSDLIIWDLEESINKDLIKENAKYILSAKEFKDEYENAEAILIKPLDYNYVKYVVKKILKKIELEEDLTFSNICLNTAVDSLPDMFWIKTLDGIHTLLNKEFCNVVNKPKEDVTGKDHYYIWDVSRDDPNSGADICKKTEDEVIEAGHLLNFQETVKIDKGIRQLITYKAPLYDKNNKAVGTVGIGHDITDLKNLSIELDILLNSIPYPVLLRDNDNIIQNVNPSFEHTFGVKAEDIIGEKYDEWALKTFHNDRETNNEGFTEASLTVGKEDKVVELRFDDIRDTFNNITGQFCIFRDVTIQRRLEEQITKNANIDFMTKLYNRRYLYKFISEQSEGCTITLLAIDLDHFKSVNDTYGHKMGDEAIILASNTIRECFKNDLVVRMGGDEFLVVKIGSNDLEKVGSEAQNLIDELQKCFKRKEEFKNLSASIGIAQGEHKKGSLDRLLNNSDKAMYESKQNGRACYSIYNQ